MQNFGENEEILYYDTPLFSRLPPLLEPTFKISVKFTYDTTQARWRIESPWGNLKKNNCFMAQTEQVTQQVTGFTCPILQ